MAENKWLTGVISALPIPSAYDIFTYIQLIFMVNVGKYTGPMDPMGYKWSYFTLLKKLCFPGL